MVSTAQNVFYGNSEKPTTASEKPVENTPRRLTPAERDTLLTAVREWEDAGCHVHPARCNGSKNPVSVEGAGTDIEPDLIPMTWPNGKPRQGGGQPNPKAGQWGYGYQRIRDGLMPRLTVDEMAGWFRQGRSDGIGVFCGVGSGGLEMVEVEGRARDLLPKIRDAADRLGVRPLLDRLSHGCVSESPSNGLHFLLRVSDAPAEGSQKLAARPDPNEPGGVLVLAETRGQGGWFVAAPSAGRTHKSGRSYRLLRVGPSTIPTFTAIERDLIYQCFRAIDEMPQQQVVDKPRRPARQRREGDPLTTAEDFCLRAKWDDILVPKGWTKYGQQKQRALEGGGTYPTQEWSRPGREGSKSATTTGSTLCCWSSSSPLPTFKRPRERGGRGENVLSKFAVYAYLHHAKPDGTPDWPAATDALRDQGYGEDDELDGIRPVVVEQMPVNDDTRTLQEWQAEVAAVRAMTVERIGFSLDRSPTGAGKTYATTQMLKAVSTSLTALPTHKNVVERVKEMQGQDIDAVAYPELSQSTCQNYAEASRAQSFGLIAGAAVCPGCPFNIDKTCRRSDQYLGLMRAAHKADHRICTHERLRLSADKVVDKAAVIVIDETPESVVAPKIEVPVEDLGLVDNLAREVLERWDAGTPSADEAAFARALRATYAAITSAAMTAGAAGVVDIEVPVHHEDPRTWQGMIYGWIKRLGVADLTPAGQQRFQQAMHLLTRATTGGLRSLRLLVEQTNRHERQADGTVVESRPLHQYVVGEWLTVLTNKPVFLLDATGSADDLRAVTGQDVDDLTPAGHLAYQRPVVQVVVDVTKGQQAKTVAGIIGDFLTTHPGVRRLGVIGHQGQIRGVMGDDDDLGLLPAELRGRIHKWTYFGAGDDRASNGWHGEGNCDHLLVIGTPRRRGAVIRSWLAHHGLREAADLPGGDWGPRHWEAVTVAGVAITAEGKGYRNPDWHRANTAIIRADLQQAIGRARAILADGIPVTVFSDEPAGLPVDDQPGIVTSAVRETVEVVRGALAGRPLGRAHADGGRATEKVVDHSDPLVAPMRTGDGQTTQILYSGTRFKSRPCGRGTGVVRGALAGRPLVCAIPSTRNLVGGFAQTEGRLRTARAVHALVTTCGIGRRAAQIRLADAVKAGRLGKPERGWLSVQLDVVPAPDDPQQAVVVQTMPAASPLDVAAPAGPGVVVTAFPVVESYQQADVVAVVSLETTTSICTLTAPTGAALVVDLPDDEPAGRTDVVGVDAPALAIRSDRFVSGVLQHVSGTVRVISPHDDPFSRGCGRPAAKAVPGRCRCGSEQWRDVSIHGGQSVRRDCARCDKYGGHVVWYGKPLPWPPSKARPRQPATRTTSPAPMSFLSPMADMALVSVP